MQLKGNAIDIRVVSMREVDGGKGGEQTRNEAKRNKKSQASFGNDLFRARNLSNYRFSSAQRLKENGKKSIAISR